MLSYDAWKRTYDVVHKMLWRQSHPQFLLPPPPPEKRARYGNFDKFHDEQADARWWEEHTPASTTFVRDADVVAYQIGQVILCRAECEDYLGMVQADNPQANLLKLRQQDISEWDSCECCGKELWLGDDIIDTVVDMDTEDIVANLEEVADYDDSEANTPRSPMVHLVGRTQLIGA